MTDAARETGGGECRLTTQHEEMLKDPGYATAFYKALSEEYRAIAAAQSARLEEAKKVIERLLCQWSSHASRLRMREERGDLFTGKDAADLDAYDEATAYLARDAKGVGDA